MPRTRPGWLIVVALASAFTADAVADRVRTAEGSVEGRVIQSTRTEVVTQTKAGRVTTPVGEIVAILYDDEPVELAQARINAASGGYANALDRLSALPAGKTWPEPIEREIAYLRSVAAVRIAIAQNEGARAAGRALTDFLRQHGETHHYLPAVEALGDLLASLGRTDDAVKRYKLLSDSGSPTYALRAQQRIAQAYDEAGRPQQAAAAYNAALALSSAGSAEHRAALLGRAANQAAAGDPAAGIEAVREVILAPGADDPRVLAAAYNSLARCYLAAEQPQDALFALLHTDLLYDTDAELHAEALFRLEAVWSALGHPTKAADVRERLSRRYAATRWAKRPPGS
ncbi:hypothetical protein [Botrimarina hoheduenensis]|uniref:Tetratricopeptide repeat protein n=1 Tax=Botrimarina hoheduenensis TaxID=2528000 RepID=A0A5C5VYI5_9BACT|nr:hypothetical protein [Botrimarina hoheduenensis]TWT43207.1 hypothetical protein Pla111_21570 [Botrimarina hoheduenensis]